MLFISFLPILLFVALYVGSGIYFSLQGVHNAFYQLSPVVAILPAIALGWILQRGNGDQKMRKFIDGVRHPDIITMCIIFLLAGAFSSITNSIGSVESTVNAALSFVSPCFLLIGLFLTSAFISVGIGTSMGTIATIGPIAVGLAAQGVISPIIGMATVIGGSMFGDNLSIISDTTIAAVMSQEARMREKFKFNGMISVIAAVITMVILYFSQENGAPLVVGSFSWLLVLPYVLLIALALSGMNVLIAIFLSIIGAWGIGFLHHGYSLFALSGDIVKGFMSMYEILILSLLVGGLSGLSGDSTQKLAHRISLFMNRWQGGATLAQLMIGAIVSLFDILLANNTIAIIFSGEIARDIAKKYRIPAHYSASWLDIFSCVFQGIIPYGAQLLLASTLAGVSPLSLMPYVFYCYILAIVAVGYIMLQKKETKLA